jgi:predicted nucleic acid-binding protein
MIVLDASVAIDYLLRIDWEPIAQRLLAVGESWHAPHLLDLEVAQVLRRYAAGGELSAARGRQALEDLAVLPIARYGHEPLLARIWQLRPNLTAYDAAYVALAEALEAPLLTRDRRLAGAPGHRAAVELL